MLVTLLVASGLVKNSTEARNALAGKSVKVDNEIQSDPKFEVKLSGSQYILLQVGKKKFVMVKRK